MEYIIEVTPTPTPLPLPEFPDHLFNPTKE